MRLKAFIASAPCRASRILRRLCWSAALFAAAVAIPGVATPAAASESVDSEESLLRWRHSTQDIYLNGELSPEVEVLSAEGSHWALAFPDSARVLVLLPSDEETAVAELDRKDFAWSVDRLTAESPRPEGRIEAELFELPNGLWIRLPGREGLDHVMITSHQGGSGPLQSEKLWKTVPVWQSARDAYEPSAEAVETFREEERSLKLKIYLGTWCGDSRRSVPRLMAALKAAQNAKLEVELVAVGRGFTEPLGDIRRDRVTNVPTILVLEGDREIGRFVERPHSDNVETDVAAILAGRPLPPKSFFDDQDRLIAQGRYGLFDPQDLRVGEEEWRLFETEAGDLRLYAGRWQAGERTEVWQRHSPSDDSGFVEITRHSEGELSRTRASFSETSLSATTRGSEGGIIKQTASLGGDRGGRAAVLSPTVSGWGVAWAQTKRPKSHLSTEGFFLPGAGRPTAGQKRPLIFDWQGRSEEGGRPCDSVAIKWADQAGSLCLHPELDVPIFLSWQGLEARLEHFETVDDGAESDVKSAKEIAAP